jgi:hypothetical protein
MTLEQLKETLSTAVASPPLPEEYVQEILDSAAAVLLHSIRGKSSLTLEDIRSIREVILLMKGVSKQHGVPLSPDFLQATDHMEEAWANLAQITSPEEEP